MQCKDEENSIVENKVHLISNRLIIDRQKLFLFDGNKDTCIDIGREQTSDLQDFEVEFRIFIERRNGMYMWLFRDYFSAYESTRLSAGIST